jgi:hypothetical protein
MRYREKQTLPGQQATLHYSTVVFAQTAAGLHGRYLRAPYRD